MFFNKFGTKSKSKNILDATILPKKVNFGKLGDYKIETKTSLVHTIVCRIFFDIGVANIQYQ